MKEYYEKYGLIVEREKCMKEGSIIMYLVFVNCDVEIVSEFVECECLCIFK